MSKGIRGVRIDNCKVIRVLGPRTEYFERNFCLSINYSTIWWLEKLKSLFTYKFRKVKYPTKVTTNKSNPLCTKAVT